MTDKDKELVVFTAAMLIVANDEDMSLRQARTAARLTLATQTVLSEQGRIIL